MIKQLKPGDTAALKVVRASEMGVFLDAGTGNTSEDILLHKGQQIREVAIGEELTVYLYLDPKGRLTASMRLPQMKEGQVARTTVVNVTKDGAFVDVGTERGVFMPFAGMRGTVRCGDKVWIKLYRDKSGRPAVTMEVEEELQQAAVPAAGITIGDTITGSVYNYSDDGAFLFTNQRNIAFLHKDEMTTRLKVGEEASLRVTYVREDGKLNVSQRPLKQDAIGIDSQNLLDFMGVRGGSMPYSDDTAAEVIKQKFNISKAAFKRALGRLLKENLVEQREGWTYLKQTEDTAES